jgi:hypothetical protein
MRAAFLLPLAFTTALLAGCGSAVPRPPEQETATRRGALPDRDLTLRAATPAAVVVASPVELARPVTAPRRTSRPAVARKSAGVPTPERPPAAAPVAAEPVAAEPVAAEPVAAAAAPVEPAPEERSAGAGRELAPGRTVTLVPASSGPTVEADEDDSWLPSERPRGVLGGSGGGTCRPRGGMRGTGVAGRIPVGPPARRLR